MRKRTWSYTDITMSAQSCIDIAMRNAQQASIEGDIESARIHRNHAWGIFWGWQTLTAGRQNAGDEARLEAMTVMKKEGE